MIVSVPLTLTLVLSAILCKLYLILYHGAHFYSYWFCWHITLTVLPQISILSVRLSILFWWQKLYITCWTWCIWFEIESTDAVSTIQKFLFLQKWYLIVILVDLQSKLILVQSQQEELSLPWSCAILVLAKYSCCSSGSIIFFL